MARREDAFVELQGGTPQPSILRIGNRCCCGEVLHRDLVEVRRFGRIVRWEHPLCGGTLSSDEYTPPPTTWDERVAFAIKLREIQAGRQAGGPPEMVDRLLHEWYSMRGGC